MADQELLLITKKVKQEIESREQFDAVSLQKILRHKQCKSSRKANKELDKIKKETEGAKRDFSVKEKRIPKKSRIIGENNPRKNRNHLERIRIIEDAETPAPYLTENSIRTLYGGLPETNRRK